jgi:hypothetical protein
MDKIDQEKTKNLADGKRFRLDEIPLRKFYDQAQYIEKTLLPAVEKSRGRQSADYQFFESVYKSLLYAVMIADREQALVKKVQHYRQLSDFYESRAKLSEAELMKYTTLENLYISGGLEIISSGIAQRVNDLLTNK